MNNKNLVIIDYQNDFVKIDAPLSCGQSGINIEQGIVNKINEYKDDNIFITLDTHYSTDWDEETKTKEADNYPMHCVFGTEGHELYGKVFKTLEEFQHTIIYKNSFATDKLAKKIIEKNNCNKKVIIEICGVATSVCVYQNTVHLYNYFVTNNIDFEIIIDKNNVACFDEELEKSVFKLLEHLGVNLKGNR